MYRVIDGKDTGKTKKLLQECANNNGLYVCRHPNGVKEKCLVYGIPVVEAIGYGDFLLRDDWRTRKVYIDELEYFVEEMVAPNFAGYTLSKED